ncbi:hypothetical protein [Niallia sp. FSL R7-0271]|uniref:hypothetical protein n=1 Tax=Niallia sp. FSL R7-0271 TaxID=2921678 RepID=UPI0030F7113A
MNKTLSTFLGIAITVITISAFLFIGGYNLVNSETSAYGTKVTNMQTNLPSGTGK